MGGDLGYVPVSGTDDPDTSVDPDFRMLLKKVTKKDTATKLKVGVERFVGCIREIINLKIHRSMYM